MTDAPDFAKQAQDMMENAKKLAQPELAQKLIREGIERTKEAYDKAASSIGSASKEYGKVLTSAQSGTQKLREKALENFTANSDTVFEYASALANCKTPAEAVEVQTKFLKKEFELLNQQTKEFFELSNEVTINVFQSAAEAAKKSSSS